MENNKLAVLIRALTRKQRALMSVENNEEYATAIAESEVAKNKLVKLANKIGETAWNKMLSRSEFAYSSHKWNEYRDYMTKQKA